MKFRRYVYSILVLLLVFWTGCQKKDAPEVQEKVLRYPLATKIKSLDTGNIEDVYGMMIASNICESLYEYDYLKRPSALKPMLADGMPQISDDHLTYTIKIKKGILFQDDKCFPDGKGRELKAGDFVFAFKRIANIRYASPNWGDLKDRIAGLDDFREYTKQFKTEYDIDYSREVEGLKALDDYTLLIRLVKPWPQILYNLAQATSAPVAKEAVDYYKQDMNYHPVGTGPYFLKKWHKGIYIELVRNPNFRPEFFPSEGMSEDIESGLLAAAGQRLPFVDRIVYRIIEEAQPTWLLFMRGELDLSGIPKDNFNSAVDLNTLRPTAEISKRDIHLKKYDEPSLFYLGFNMHDHVLANNLPLRKAISLAINRERINELFYNGRWKVAKSLIHPDLSEYDPNVVNAGYSDYNPRRARELVKEAEKINGGPIPELTITSMGGDTFSRQFNLFYQRELETIGLKAKIDATDWPTYSDRLNKGQMQMFGGGGVKFNTPDAIGVLSMFATKYLAPLGNYFFYSKAEYDSLFEKAEVMFEGPERTKLYRRMERMVLDDCPAVLTTHKVQYLLLHGWVKNFKPHPFLYGNMKYLDIDMEKQRSYKKLTKELDKKE